MDWIVVAGTLCLGFMIGCMVGYYVNEAETMSYHVLSSAIYVLAGSGVMAIFHLLSPGNPTRELWLYPVGLLIGFLSAPVVDIAIERFYKKLAPELLKEKRKSSGKAKS